MWWQRQCPDKPSSPASRLSLRHIDCVSEGEITSRRWTDISKPLSSWERRMDGWMAVGVRCSSQPAGDCVTQSAAAAAAAAGLLLQSAPTSERRLNTGAVDYTKTLLSGRLCWLSAAPSTQRWSPVYFRLILLPSAAVRGNWVVSMPTTPVWSVVFLVSSSFSVIVLVDCYNDVLS